MALRHALHTAVTALRRGDVSAVPLVLATAKTALVTHGWHGGAVETALLDALLQHLAGDVLPTCSRELRGAVTWFFFLPGHDEDGGGVDGGAAADVTDAAGVAEVCVTGAPPYGALAAFNAACVALAAASTSSVAVKPSVACVADTRLLNDLVASQHFPDIVCGPADDAGSGGSASPTAVSERGRVAVQLLCSLPDKAANACRGEVPPALRPQPYFHSIARCVADRVLRLAATVGGDTAGAAHRPSPWLRELLDRLCRRGCGAAVARGWCSSAFRMTQESSNTVDRGGADPTAPTPREGCTGHGWLRLDAVNVHVAAGLSLLLSLVPADCCDALLSSMLQHVATSHRGARAAFPVAAATTGPGAPPTSHIQHLMGHVVAVLGVSAYVLALASAPLLVSLPREGSGSLRVAAARCASALVASAISSSSSAMVSF